MKKINHNLPPVSYSCDLLKLDQELCSPKISALIEQGYSIKAVIPVEDQGKPIAILILEAQKIENKNTTLYIIITLLIALLGSSVADLLHSFTL